MNLVVPSPFHQILSYDEMPPEADGKRLVRADPRLLQFAADPFVECRVFRSADRI